MKVVHQLPGGPNCRESVEKREDHGGGQDDLGVGAQPVAIREGGRGSGGRRVGCVDGEEDPIVMDRHPKRELLGWPVEMTEFGRRGKVAKESFFEMVPRDGRSIHLSTHA